MDSDQSFLGRHILTSVVKRYDIALYRELRALARHRFRTGATVSLGLRENGVGLGRISGKVPPRFVHALKSVRARIVDGSIRVPSRIN